MDSFNDRREEGSYFFKFLLLANTCMYLEAGAIPALLLQISESFDLSSGKQGMLGGVAYLSLGFGSPFAAYLLKRLDNKVVICNAIGTNSICTLLWSLTPVGAWYSQGLFIGIRFVMGLMQCILCVYLPLWVHEFAPPSQRAKWMGALQGSVPIGVMIGYIIAAVLVGPVSSTDICFHLLCWRWPLLFEWALLFPFCIAIHFVPSRYFELHEKIIPEKIFMKSNVNSYDTFEVGMRNDAEQEGASELFKAHSFAGCERGYNIREWNERIVRRNSWHSDPRTSSLFASLFTTVPAGAFKKMNESLDDDSIEDLGSRNITSRENQAIGLLENELVQSCENDDAATFSHLFRNDGDSQSSLEPISTLMRIPLYRSLLCGLSGLYFVVTGVQYWSTSYMILLFGDEYRPLINTMFIFCAATAPTGGVLAGSWIVDELGGYCGRNQRHIALRFCSMCGLSGCIFAACASQTANVYLFVLFLWLLLFFGGCILPASSGILVSIVPHQYRTISSSFSLMMFNIFGYFLSLCISGYIMEAASSVFKDCDEVCAHIFGYHIILLWSLFSFLFLLSAWSSSTF